MWRVKASCVVLPDQGKETTRATSSRGATSRCSFAGMMIWYGLALVLVVLDQYTKTVATGAMVYGEQIVVTPYFNWTLLHNTGAAFSFLSDAGGWQNAFFCAVAGAVSVYIVYWLYQTPKSQIWQSLALSLILGGAIGNLYDRLMLGYVVDFIQVHYQQYYWPAFNVADSAICVGAFLLILSSFLYKELYKEPSKELPTELPKDSLKDE